MAKHSLFFCREKHFASSFFIGEGGAKFFSFAMGIWLLLSVSPLLQAVGNVSPKSYIERAAFIEPKASVELAASAEQVTPGQLIELHLNVQYEDGVEVRFVPEKQPWGTLERVSFSQWQPVWKAGHWLQSFTLQVAAGVPGEYPLPSFTVDFFRGGDHWQMSSQPLSFQVVSAFAAAGPGGNRAGQGNVQLQKVIPLPAMNKAPASSPTAVILLMVFLGFTVVVSIWFRGRKVVSRKSDGAAILFPERLSPEMLARKAGDTGVAEWEGLRCWLMQVTGSDPLGKLTTHEALLHEYQRLRFTRDTPVEGFISLCNGCQEKWG